MKHAIGRDRNIHDRSNRDRDNSGTCGTRVTGLPALARVAHGLVFLLLLAGLGTQPVQAQRQSVNETRPASATGKVEIENLAGSVVVSGWDREEVSVQGELEEKVTLEFTGSGGNTRVVVRHPQRERKHRGSREGTDLEIRVPSGSVVDVETVSASIRVSGVSGGLALESVSGEIEVAAAAAKGDKAPRRLRVNSVSGSVTITGDMARVEAESVSGEVRLAIASGEAAVSSVSGSVIIDGGRLEEVEASSVSGTIRFRGEFVADGRYELSSHSGSVEVDVPGNSSAEFSVSTFSGEIRSDFGESERTGGPGPGRELHFTAGSGGAQVEVSSFSGLIEILQR